MKLIPLAVSGAIVGVARDWRDTLPDDWTGGKRYPFYAAGEAALGFGVAYYTPEPWDNLGLAAIAFGFKDLTWIAMHWPCCGYT